jgi:excisionase family DNA binding protein
MSRKRIAPARTTLPEPQCGPILEALTIAEAGRELRASESTVRRLVDTGRLRAVQVGKAKRIILRRDLLAFAFGAAEGQS